MKSLANSNWWLEKPSQIAKLCDLDCQLTQWNEICWNLYLSGTGNSWVLTPSRHQALRCQSAVTRLLMLCAKLLQACLTLCDHTDGSPPGSSVHRALLARILEWVAVPSSGGISWPRDRTCISCISRRVLDHYHRLGTPDFSLVTI